MTDGRRDCGRCALHVDDWDCLDDTKCERGHALWRMEGRGMMGGITMDCVWDDGCEPYRAHEWDAGLDLRASDPWVVRGGSMVMVGTGFRCAVPEGHVGLLFARSSLCRRGLLLANGVGVIDAGYTGEVMVPLANVSGRSDATAVMAGERIAQLVVVPCSIPTLRRVDSLAGTDRGEGGFGSSGR